MKITYYFLISLLIIAFSGKTNAQQLKENEIVVIQGKKYILHQVRTGETIYSVNRQFQLDRQELIFHNPQIANGLKIGDILKIPFHEDAELQELPASSKGDPAYFEYFTISSRTETPYFIARKFGITVEEIYAYNPEVTRFRINTRLRIPRWESPKLISGIEKRERIVVENEKERELIMHEVQPGETLYSLTRRYKISESEILFFNPGIRDLKAGSIIYLPRTDDYVESGTTKEKTTQTGHEIIPGTYTELAGFFEHTIVSGETLWSLTHRYNVTEEELIRLNPVLKTGFPAGVSIKIPVGKTDFTGAEPVNEEAFLRHEVQPGETLYGLASLYDMTIPEIRKFNPQIENRNLIRGETLLIPKIPDEKAVAFIMRETEDSPDVEIPFFESDYYKIKLPDFIPENCKPPDSRFFSTAAYNLALFLPLFIQANDTLNKLPGWVQIPRDSLSFMEEILKMKEDTLVEMDEPKELFHKFYRESENYLQFYEGVLLAADSMRKTGMRITLNVFDTQQNPDSIRKFIYSEEFLKTDLIIGPVYPQVQEEVAAIAAKNQIPMVSPLSSQSHELNNNPYYFQVNPSRDFLAEKTAELVTEEYFNSNFIVVKTSHSGGLTEEKVVDIVREKMLHSGYWDEPGGMQFHIYDFTREGPFGFNRILSREKENVIFISSLNEGDLSVVLSNINNLTGDYSFTLIGFNRYEQFHSITDEFFHNLKLQYITPYWVDYDHPETIQFLEQFKKHFQIEPGNFGLQGYDVAFYFLNALRNFGKDFAECLSFQQVHLAQGNYHFEKVSQYGGYMNQGVSVISYERNYDVVRKRVIGSYRFAQK